MGAVRHSPLLAARKPHALPPRAPARTYTRARARTHRARLGANACTRVRQPDALAQRRVVAGHVFPGGDNSALWSGDASVASSPALAAGSADPGSVEPRAPSTRGTWALPTPPAAGSDPLASGLSYSGSPPAGVTKPNFTNYSFVEWMEAHKVQQIEDNICCGEWNLPGDRITWTFVKHHGRAGSTETTWALRQKIPSCLTVNKASTLPSELLAEYKGVFEMFDEEGNGLVKSQDLAKLMSLLGINITKRELVQMAKDVDKEGKGLFNCDNFLVLMGEHHEKSKNQDEELKEAFLVFDSERKGYIEWNTLKYVLMNAGEPLNEEEAEQMMMEADKDGDGTIDYQEFVDMMTGESFKLIK
ncbi:uncharacterized protein LOC144607907 [Rhinoraja longicauda]